MDNFLKRSNLFCCWGQFCIKGQLRGNSNRTWTTKFCIIQNCPLTGPKSFSWCKLPVSPQNEQFAWSLMMEMVGRRNTGNFFWQTSTFSDKRETYGDGWEEKYGQIFLTNEQIFPTNGKICLLWPTCHQLQEWIYEAGIPYPSGPTWFLIVCWKRWVI